MIQRGPKSAVTLAVVPRKSWHWLSGYGPAIVLGAVIVLSWQLYTSLVQISPTILPSPSRIVTALARNADTIAAHSLTTVQETLLGFGLAVLTAVILAVSIDAWAALRRALYPWLVASQTVPIIALAPLMLIWFGFGLLPKVLLVALFCFFPIVVATADGLARTEPELMKLMRSMRATRWQMLKLVRWPAALPSFFSGLRIAATYSVTAAIFAEYVGGYQGLGIFMQMAANSRATALVFAGIFVTALVSLALFTLMSMIERLVVPWRFR